MLLVYIVLEIYNFPFSGVAFYEVLRTEVHTRVTVFPLFHMAFIVNSSFRYCLRDVQAEEIEGPGLEGCGLGGAGVEGTLLTQTDPESREGRKAFQ